MRKHFRRCYRLPAALLVVAVLLLLVASTTIAQNTRYRTQPYAIGKDSGWPRQIDTSDGRVLVYQPQPGSLKSDRLQAKSAVSVTPRGRSTRYFGTVWFNSRLLTNRDTRMASLTRVHITRIRFTHAPARLTDRLNKAVRTAFTTADMTVSMDRLMTSLEAARGNMDPDNLSSKPPRIIYVDYPAVLVVLDGPPVLRPVSGARVERVMNTPFFMVYDEDTDRNYLYGGGIWYSSASLTSDNWRTESHPPSEVVRIQQRTQTQVGAETTAPTTAGNEAPRVIVEQEPTELISSNGNPRYSRISGTSLSYMNNTDKDVFLDTSAQMYYVLLSGRWYRSPSLDGPWVFVPANRLPRDFSAIPTDSPKARVRASVAGTQEANDAVIDAQIPQTSTIRRDATGPNVQYDGDPRFQRIEDTDMSWAVNTPSQVLEIGNDYYCCDQGVWYDSNRPTGPWAVATSIPDDVLVIPPTNPLFNTKYVYISGYTEDYVDCGYYPGYVGTYIFGPTVVWGTGYYYHGWYGGLACPRPLTWGVSAGYVPWTGSWAFGIGYYPGWFDWGYGWGSGWNWWWGPFGFYYYDREYHHHHDHYDHEDHGRYDHHGYHDRDHDIYNRDENRHRNFRSPSERRMREYPRSRREPNNVFSDRNGNIYRRNPNGWERRGTNGWSRPVPPTREPSGTQQRRYQRTPNIPSGQLESEYRARQRGEQRTNNFGRYNRGVTPGGMGGAGRAPSRGYGGTPSGGAHGGGFGGSRGGAPSGGPRGGGFGGGTRGGVGGHR